jgi:capsular polysaccharide transport system permease protein
MTNTDTNSTATATATTRRSRARIMFSTWRALFLRTAVVRVSGTRFAWFWLIAEPLWAIVLLMLVFTFLRVRHIGGIDIAIWLMAGVLAFSMFRRTASQGSRAVRASRALFSYPQIRPFDPVVVHAALEGFLMVLVSIALLAGATLIEYDVVPQDPLAVLRALLGMWLIGLGYGLVHAAARELSRVADWCMTKVARPLYILSGVIIPITMVVPYPYREWLFYNPLVHGLESMRFAFAPYYKLAPEVSMPYLYGWALCLVFLGTGLHARYAVQLAKARSKREPESFDD